VIRLEDYRLAKRVPEFITLINPVPQKGLDLVLSIAGLLPRRAFLLVESWSLSAQALRRLYERLKNYPNVTLVRWTAEMKSVYCRTAVLLIPSQWEESFARVALEAQVSGIPVVARDIGGIGEVLGDSGILLPQNAAAQEWAQTIERLLSDQSFYAACSAAASINAGRPEFDPFHQVDRFLAIATELTAK
jgi:glycosyltransferase involved in cell wall biosynthesis